MKYEVEKKFPVDDLNEVVAKLEELSATFSEPVVQVDRYFAHPVRDFASTDEALRIRSVGTENCVTYKGPKIDATTKTRREIELPLASGTERADEYTELLQVLSFRPVAEVRKKRRAAQLVWRDFPVEIALDTVEQVGTFVELEIQADKESLDRAKQSIENLAGRLGLAKSERRSYLELLPGNGE
jgi:adenylate cyclase class 2